ncbi:MAG TPA: hypothetical protein VJ859_08770 [Allosphingosinicella sp.]|nr:hypothetical protein [Allosphingosinicella sp.]
MLTATLQPPAKAFSQRLAMRGYNVLYREGELNFCPGCGRSHWYVGRLLAECAYCGTAVPLAEIHLQSASGGHSRNRKRFEPSLLAA